MSLTNQNQSENSKGKKKGGAKGTQNTVKPTKMNVAKPKVNIPRKTGG